MNNTNHLRMKDLPDSEKPYEKLEKLGPERLSDAELLAIIIKTGTKEETSLTLAHRILNNGQAKLNCIVDFSMEDLMKVKGIGKVKAVQIKAAIELGKRFINYENTNKFYIKAPQDVADILMEDMRHYKKEHVKAILLTTKNQIIKIIDIAIGSLNSSIVHPREVYNEAVRCGSASVILVHNHPSGDPAPSKEDIAITERIFESGKILGIELLDHIIIGDKKFISLKENNVF